MMRTAILFVSACAAQALASGAFLGALALYNRSHPGQEAWPVLGMALISAFAAEVICLWLVLGWLNASRSLFLLGRIVTSWAAGIVSFLFFNMPRLSWCIAAFVLFLLLPGLNKLKPR